MDEFKELNHVLIVDMNQEEADFYKEILKNLIKVRIHIAKNVQDALEYISKVNFTLVVADESIEDMNICQFVVAVKSLSPITDTIITTSKPDTSDAVKVMKMGACDYLIKPFEKEIFEQAVVKCLKNKEKKEEIFWESLIKEDLGNENDDTAFVKSEMMSVAMDSVFRLTTVAEYKEGAIKGHLKRISAYSSLIAKKLGFPEYRVRMIEVASMMHDIGKVGISDNILLKPGKLTPDEFEEIKKHTTIGAHILMGSRHGLLRLASVIALSHHEKYDGTGYPQGLIGEAIPLSGRIVALADVFDALTSRRVYKPPFPMKKSLEIMAAESKKHFDPVILKHFLQSEDVLKKIMEESSDYQAAE